MITHIVLFKLHEPLPDVILEAKDRLSGMVGRVPQLRHIEVGIDVIHSDRSYDIALVTKFDTLEDLKAYQGHPYHAEQIVPYVRSISSSIIAVDYESD